MPSVIRRESNGKWFVHSGGKVPHPIADFVALHPIFDSETNRPILHAGDRMDSARMSLLASYGADNLDLVHHHGRIAFPCLIETQDRVPV
jgi:hypothetical protein